MGDQVVIAVFLLILCVSAVVAFGAFVLAVEWAGVLFEALRPVSAVCGG